MAKKPIEPSEMPESDDFIEPSEVPEPSDISESEKAIDTNKDGDSLQFKRLKDIVERLEKIDLTPSEMPESDKNKSKTGLIAFILIFAVGLVGYFLLKKPENPQDKA